jgi:hypothetical protein
MCTTENKHTTLKDRNIKVVLIACIEKKKERKTTAKSFQVERNTFRTLRG